jgi:hypothetical protein
VFFLQYYPTFSGRRHVTTPSTDVSATLDLANSVLFARTIVYFQWFEYLWIGQSPTTLLSRDSCSTDNVVVVPAKGHIGVFYLTLQIVA